MKLREFRELAKKHLKAKLDNSNRIVGVDSFYDVIDYNYRVRANDMLNKSMYDIHKEEINNAFIEYYKYMGASATHIFIYNAVKDLGSTRKKSYINYKQFSELYSRDIEKTHDINDVFIGVGVIEDIVIKP